MWQQSMIVRLSIFAGALLLTVAAQANLVINPGFETGTFSPWTQTGDTSFSGIDPFAARTGTYGAYFGPSSIGGISQTISTTAGATYNVGFELSNSGGLPNSFAFTWNGVTQQTFSDAPAFGYTHFDFSLTTVGTAATLGFSFLNPEAFWLLDEVTVNLAGSPGGVPEPATLALLGLGLAGLGFSRRKQ